jgi:hypothetical protein
MKPDAVIPSLDLASVVSPMQFAGKSKSQRSMQPPRTSDKVSEAAKGKYRTFGFSSDFDDVIAAARVGGGDHVELASYA